MRRLHAHLWPLLFFSSLLLLGGCRLRKDPNIPLDPQQTRGRIIFRRSCAICHDAYSTSPQQGPGLEGLFKNKYLPASGAPANDERVREVIQSGRRTMPAFSNLLDDQQMDDLMAFLHTL